jgi:hypothetical protein
MGVKVTQTSGGDPAELDVEIADARGRTRHRVTLTHATLARLGGGASPEEFVAAAFAFLLDRESKESILSRFDVDVIARYFPEFEGAIEQYVKRA